MKIYLTYNRSTKNTHVYIEDAVVGMQFVVGTLYVQKHSFPLPPEKLSVIIQPEA